MTSNYSIIRCSGAALALATLAAGFAPLLHADEHDVSGTLYLMPTGVNLSGYAGGLSRDGSTVGGQYFLDNFDGGMLIWNNEAGLVAIGQPSMVGGAAYGVSYYGNLGAGNRGAYPFRWSSDGTLEALRNQEGNVFIGDAILISSDGNVIAGTRNDGAGNPIPFIWTEEGGLVDLPMPEGYSRSDVRAISQDGSVIVGYVSAPDVITVPAIWTGTTLVATLEVEQSGQFSQGVDILPGGDIMLVNLSGSTVARSYVYDIEDDEVILLPENANPAAFIRIYDEEEEREELVIVGSQWRREGVRIFNTAHAWEMNDEGNIIDEVNVDEMLKERLGLLPEENWTFTRISAISASGDVFVGMVERGNASYNFIYDAEGEAGVVMVPFGEGSGQGQRFAELIENGTDIGDMWVLTSWFGYIWTGVYTAQEWVYHAQLGWLYVPALPDLETGYWFYANNFLQWIYTEDDIFPWVYQSEDAEWTFLE